MSSFLITGCGRSGTKYTATLLSRLGCGCGHEKIFHTGSLRVRFRTQIHRVTENLKADFESEVVGQLPGSGAVEDARRNFDSRGESSLSRVFECRLFYHPADLRGRGIFPWPDGPFGESSWLAAPYLDSLPEGTVVLHQVRNPLLVVRSWLRIRLFERAGSVYRDFIEEHCPALREGTPVERAMKYWVEWNRLVQRAESFSHLRYLRYRVDDLDDSLLGKIFALIGFDCDSESICGAVRSQARNVNTRGSRENDSRIQLGSLPNPELREDLLDLAREYGFAMAPLVGSSTGGEIRSTRAVSPTIG